MCWSERLKKHLVAFVFALHHASVVTASVCGCRVRSVHVYLCVRECVWVSPSELELAWVSFKSELHAVPCTFFVHRSTCEIDSVWSWVNLSAYPQAVSFRTSKLVWGNAHSGSTNQVVLMQDARTHSKLWQPIVKYDPISPNLAGIECCVHTNSRRRSAYSPMLISQVNVCAGTVSGWT